MKAWKDWIIFKPIVDFYNMFFNNDKGFSLRKAAGVMGIICATLSFARLKDEKYILESGNIWLIFTGVCFGLIAIPELIKFISILVKGKSDEKTDNNNPS